MMCNREELNFAGKFDAIWAKNSDIHKGEVWFVDLGDVDPETKDCGKVRPCIVFQNDRWNAMEGSTVGIIPLSSSPMYNCYDDELIGLRLPGYSNYSILGFNRIKFVDKKQFKYRVATISDDLMHIITVYSIKNQK